MKYNELINFEPITSVIKLTDANDFNNQIRFIKTYVFSEQIISSLKNIIVKNLNPVPDYETKGIYIVGGYGTGKSHLMAVVSAIAENEEMLNYLDDNIKPIFKPIAGKYKVLRFEPGSNAALKDYVFTYIEKYLNSQNIDFEFAKYEKLNEKDQIINMMVAFQEQFPDKHFLIIIDELLDFLKSKPQNEIIGNFFFLRQIGELCDKSRFKFIGSVQEILYQTPEFQFVADTLAKIEDRFDDVIISKEDIAFVVKNRILKKDEHQKEEIRKHLIKYQNYFDSINNNFNEFVEFFPVHPKYIDYFTKIKHGKNQREILKVLSEIFDKIAEQNIPENNPGLITYDTYWDNIIDNSLVDTYPDIRKVKEIWEIIKDRIENHFCGARISRLPLATSIVKALCINVLCDDLTKNNGSTPQALLNDLCITIPSIDKPEFLLDVYRNTCKQLIEATSGQYIDVDMYGNNYYIRTEGGINVKQEISNYAETVIKRDNQKADQVYFDFLRYILELSTDTYKTGFKIWEDTLIWKDKNIFRLGYIFFGNPNERSTTIPIQQYYIYFLPLFSIIERNDETDEVYFDMSQFDNDFREVIYLYGAASNLEFSSSSSSKNLFKKEKEELLKKAIEHFKRIYRQKTDVIYRGEKKPLDHYFLLSEDHSIIKIFKNVAETILNTHFNNKYIDYPAFLDLRYPIEKNNFDQKIRDALKKIVNPDRPNSDGEAVLKGLNLISGNNIDISQSKYCDEVLKRLNNIDETSVINRADLLITHYAPLNMYYAKCYNLDYRLFFLVLAALVYKGEIEIYYSREKVINATNLNLLSSLKDEEFFSYQFIRKPKGISIQSIKKLFEVLFFSDRTSDLDNPETISQIITKSRKMLDEVIQAETILNEGIRCKSVEVFTNEKILQYKAELKALHEILDKICNINTVGKLKMFNILPDELDLKFAAYRLCGKINDIKSNAEKLESLISYLYAAKSYIIDSEQKLIDDIDNAIKRLPDILQSEDSEVIKKYINEINTLIDLYVNYYMKMGVNFYISANDNAVKNNLLNSDTKKILDILKDINIINASQYSLWLDDITSLKVMPINFTRDNIKQNPNISFNPREYVYRSKATVSKLANDLRNILEIWTNNIITQLNDPTVKNNYYLLENDEKNLVESLTNGKTEITLDNVYQIRNIINKLTQNFEKIEIDTEEVKQILQKPLTPKEAVQLFSDYIDKKCSGKDRAKIKLIIK